MARRNLLLTCRRAGDEGAALREAVRGLVHHPSDEQLFEEGVHAAMALGDGDALKHLCQVRIEACATDSTPHRYLGVWALEHERSPVLAQAHFQRALDCDPDDAEAKEALARLDGALPQAGPTRTRPGGPWPRAARGLGAAAASWDGIRRCGAWTSSGAQRLSRAHTGSPELEDAAGPARARAAVAAGGPARDARARTEPWGAAPAHPLTNAQHRTDSDSDSRNKGKHDELPSTPQRDPGRRYYGACPVTGPGRSGCTFRGGDLVSEGR